MTKGFRFYHHGGPEVLRWEDVEVGDPGPGQLRLRHTAVAVNFRDIYVRRSGHGPVSFPSGIGVESAGVVEAIGPDVTGIEVGDRVACVAGPESAYAEARLIPAARAVALPDGIDDRTAASMMIRGMTARYLLRDVWTVKPGEAILIHAAAGGVGLLVCQWAKHLGATVIGTVGSGEKAEIARAHGCDHAIVYATEDFVERTRSLTGGKGVDVVYDSVGKATFDGSLRCLRRRGLLVSFGEASGEPDPLPPRLLGSLGSVFLTHPSLGDYTATRDDLLAVSGDLFDMVLSGKLKVPVSHAYALKDAPQAHRDLEARRTTGAIVLVV